MLDPHNYEVKLKCVLKDLFLISHICKSLITHACTIPVIAEVAL